MIVKLSEIEKLTGIVGRRRVAQPLRIVRPMRTKNGSAIGVAMRPAIDMPSTMPPPQITAAR